MQQHGQQLKDLLSMTAHNGERPSLFLLIKLFASLNESMKILVQGKGLRLTDNDLTGQKCDHGNN
ncbi:hypothetical protein GCM10022394_23020 [Zobellella aerophila]|uniref:Uncharacterized protein n=1 Tax=Zobellella aerophila TaxID=870480 RepID=A0ABP6W1Z1_9GAMM